MGKEEESSSSNNGTTKGMGSTPYFQCPLLKATNYTIWSIRMKIILQVNGLWEMIEPTTETKIDEKQDKTAIAYLFQGLSEDMTLQVANSKSQKKFWIH